MQSRLAVCSNGPSSCTDSGFCFGGSRKGPKQADVAPANEPQPARHTLSAQNLAAAAAAASQRSSLDVGARPQVGADL